MSSKENQGVPGVTAMPVIKPEPQEQRLPPLAESTARQSNPSRDPGVTPIVTIKPEKQEPVLSFAANAAGFATSDASSSKPLVKSEPVVHAAPQPSQPGPQPQTPPFTIHSSSFDIQYAPEDGLKEGLGMVKAIKASIRKLELGSKLRKDVWMREIESLQSQGAPTTMIAVCGATGAGKSSILNAILDDNIVPTSGMRACTAVVTEIAYHAKKTIEGDVSFLSEAEWREELAVLLDDLVDEDGNVKRSTDLRSDAGVAWSKVHAVYPSVSQEQLVRMSIDQIITRNSKIKNILGTTKHIVASDSRTFGKEIGKYIDSKDQKRGEKKDKKKDKEKEKGEKTLMDKLRASVGGAEKKKDKDDSDGPAYWPLIRQVKVHCNADALSTGAILVDLPGVADANAARNNIAKDYMKKCDCIWILAPITRAVDDKTARDLMGDAFKMQLMMDGNYDANAITFIATKCDDISCSEVIRALQLEEDPKLESIEEELEQCKTETEEQKEKKLEAETNAKETDKQLKEVRAYLAEYTEHLKALENGEEFTPRLTAKPSKDASEGSPSSKKRKNKSGGKKGSSKRPKGSDASDVPIVVEDDDEDMLDVEDELTFSDSDDEKQSNKEDSDSSDSDSDSDSGSGSGSGSDSDSDEQEEEAEVTVDSLKAKIQDAKDAIKAGRAKLTEYRGDRKTASDQIAALKKRESNAQREKNAFCSLKRSEFSRDVLKEDFRVGLKDLDEAAAEQRDPDSFDPSVNLRNYDAIDLPVFTCSSRDYVRLKGQVKGDGDPACFSNSEDTGIPALQQWCHALTVSSRERSARSFLTHLKTFVKSIKTYVQGIGDVTAADRESLREKWESAPEEDNDDLMAAYAFDSDSEYDDGDMDYLRGEFSFLDMLRKMPSKVNSTAKEATGITPRLTKEFNQVIDTCVAGLKASFRDGLEEKCQIGATNAAAAAITTSDEFAASMHWATYRATLRRLGSWRQDLNVELTNPFTRNIASSWQKVFESDLFSNFDRSTQTVIATLLSEVEVSAPLGLKERARGQAEVSLADARVALQKTFEVVRDVLNTKQKDISRTLAPTVQEELRDGYLRAMEERGIGSVARQKASFRNTVASQKEYMFDDCAQGLLSQLDDVADTIGDALKAALAELAQKIEVSVAVLWEGPRDDPAQVRARAEVVADMTRIEEQVEMWTDAERSRREASQPVASTSA